MNARHLALPIARLLLRPGLAFAEQVPSPPPPPPASWSWLAPPMWHAGWGFWWVVPLLMCLAMLGIAVMAVRAWRSQGAAFPCGPWHASGRGSPPPGDPGEAALRILNERFARGELQPAEYEEKRALIEGRAPAGPAGSRA